MKKFFLAVLAIIGAFFSNAQSETFKPFKFDLAFGYAMPAGEGVKGGLLFAMEPKYAINDAIAVGLKTELAATANLVNRGSSNEYYDVKVRSVYQATGDYYFNTNGFRPFAGAGLGLMRMARVATTEDNIDNIDESDVIVSTKFAATPRAGFEAGHFRMAAAYTIAADQSSYFAVKVGVFIGGGRRR